MSDETPKYGEAIDELEEILEEIEAEDVDLDDLADKVERARALGADQGLSNRPASAGNSRHGTRLAAESRTLAALCMLKPKGVVTRAVAADNGG